MLGLLNFVLFKLYLGSAVLVGLLKMPDKVTVFLVLVAQVGDDVLGIEVRVNQSGVLLFHTSELLRDCLVTLAKHSKLSLSVL